jgi:hypothetical protein
MQTKTFLPTFALLASVSGAIAQPAPLLTAQNSILVFPLSSLTTNGVPGLTNPPSKLMVSFVPAYSTSGGGISVVNTQVWVQPYNAGYLSYFNQAVQAVTDANGNVIVTGSSYLYPTGYGWATIKYANDGTALWTNRYDGGPGDTGGSFPQYLAVDGTGNVVVTGTSQNTNTQSDVITIRYSAGGNALTTNRFNIATNFDQPTGLALDSDGNACVILESYPPAPSQVQYVTVKYDTSGGVLWTNFYQAWTNGSDYAEGIAADSANNLFVTGGATDTNGMGVVTLKYAPDGTALWTNRYHVGVIDQGRTIKVDRFGRALVADESISNNANYPIIAYSNNGGPLWTNVLAGPNYSGGYVPQLLTDTAGNVFVVGGLPGADSGGNYDIMKLSSNGVSVWTNLNVSFGISNASLSASAVDSAGNLYLAGYSGGTNSDYVTMKFAGANGTALWTNQYDGPAGGNDLALALAVDKAGEVCVTGQSTFTNGNVNFATVKYADYVIYTPPTNFIGTDTVTFVAVDDAGNSATGLVQIVVLPPTLQFNTGALRLDSQGLHLEVDGAPGTNAVVLYASTNFLSWVPLATNSPVLGSAQFLDTLTYLPARFYRAAQNAP